MIDEKRLREIEANATDVDIQTFNAIVYAGITDQTETLELISLARLGLWAKEHGIPALESIAVGIVPDHLIEVKAGTLMDKARSALAALPGKKEE